MAEIFGYMVTWTTYGSWLQGDKRGFVRDGQTLQGDERMLHFCKEFQKGTTVKLKKEEKEVVKTVILNEAERIGQKLYALVVCSNHVHIAARPCDKSIERIVGMYKSIATRALRYYGRDGKIWTKGFDKRFCFTENDIRNSVSDL